MCSVWANTTWVKETTGKLIADARDAAGLKQAELARTIGVARSTLCEWEAGPNEPPLRWLRKIAKELGTDVTALIGGRVQRQARAS